MPRTSPSQNKRTPNGSAPKAVERAPSRIKYILGALVLVASSFGIAYAVGVSDTGPIDVDNSILRANEADQNDPSRSDRSATNPNTRATTPNGGLVPTDPSTRPPAPEPEPEPESASSTDSATSTDDGTQGAPADATDDEVATTTDGANAE